MRARVTGLAVSGVVLLAACGGPARSPAPPPPVPASPPPAPVAARRVSLPMRLVSTTWRVQSVARVTMKTPTGNDDDQQVESAAVVSWSATRQAHGALQATGQVDSFTVRSSFPSPRGTQLPSPTPLILVEAILDSARVRVATRPPLANECDRPEAGAAALARELLVRVPDGMQAGDRWKDSLVTLVCRSGVPMTVYSTILSVLETVDADRLVIRREVTTRMDGKGGSAFRGLELSGTGSGVQRVEIAAQRGTVERLEGSSTLTLTATERRPGSPARTQQVVQRTELSAVRR